ncbi:DUF5666 domain-containing protein [Tunturibacter psychrotolerans]|uniref:DUF5666 domain-containing protein n=1 Tax=Tunturiibacter psychrotolerans TaxID=3069686 RepID=A0AAU7ZV76_9BACT
MQLPLTTSLVVSGSAMGILLNLNVPQATTYTPYFDGSSALAPDGGQTSFKPVFSLSAVSLAANPSTLQDGKVEDVHGQVTVSSRNALTIETDSGSSLSFNTSSSTVFAGANSTATPPVGSFVDVDAALQTDGSMLATHVQTEGTGPQYDMVGQIVEGSVQSYFFSSGREQQVQIFQTELDFMTTTFKSIRLRSSRSRGPTAPHRPGFRSHRLSMHNPSFLGKYRYANPSAANSWEYRSCNQRCYT